MECQLGFISFHNEGYLTAAMELQFNTHTGVSKYHMVYSGEVFHLPPTAHSIRISFVELCLWGNQPIFAKSNGVWLDQPHVFRYPALKCGKFLTRGFLGLGYVSMDECYAVPCRSRTLEDVENSSKDPNYAYVHEELDRFLLVRYETIAKLHEMAEVLNRMNYHSDITTTATSTTSLVSAGLGITGLIMMIPPVTPIGASFMIASASVGGAAGIASLGNYFGAMNTRTHIENHLSEVLKKDKIAMEKFLVVSKNYFSLSPNSNVPLENLDCSTDTLKKIPTMASTAYKPITIAANAKQLVQLENFFKVTQAVEQGTMTLQQASAASKASRALYEGEKLAAKGLGTFGQVIGWVGAVVTVPIEIYTLSTTIPKLMEGSPNEQAKRLLEFAKSYQEQANILQGCN